MVQVWFPGLTIPALKMKRGFLVDVWILGIHVAIPWTDLNFWDTMVIWEGFYLFNTDDITAPLSGDIGTAAEGIKTFINNPTGTLKGWIDNIAPIVTGTLLDPKGLLKKWIDGASKGVKDFIENPTGTLKGWLDAIGPAVEGFISTAETSLTMLISGIPDAVWSLAKAKLDEMAADYYERHKEET